MLEAGWRSIPGGWFAVRGRRAWLRATLAQLILLGLAPLAMRAAARLGRRRLLHRLERRWARAVAWALGSRVEIAGLQQVDSSRPHVVVALHEGLADALLLLHLPLDQRSLARDELRDWPVLGPYLRDTNQPLVEEGRRLATLRRLEAEARDIVEGGESLVIYPQGSVLGLEVGFQHGAFLLASRLGVPVLPVVISGTHEVWEHPFSPRLRFGVPLRATVLPPIPAEEFAGRRLRARAARLEATMKLLAQRPERPAARRFVPARDGFWDGYAYRIDPHFAEVAREVALHRAQPARVSAT